ncbi:nuclear transport factor 2 family protein [Dyadobacter luteus]|uniref:Nuclear transport factor 2 family protein n=1 Tax=Dyadobacter luteus TaxID=2259619 RepID=A0A3D8Y8U9_9BACT|nr:nuclear transport factor 2 family protein [Dyadobacter luteus]REA59738.1 nuclear transport factor 2 family protein [Dyadobacter luteus]
MTENEKLIDQFYSAFAKGDYKTMQSCYADNATFSDAAFVDLNSAEVKAMWEMLCKNGKDFQLSYSNVKDKENGASADWVATYTFSKTGNKVTNRIHADFKIVNGKIISHRDHFDFYTWAKQAFGTTGLLIGWTGFFKNKVRTTARENLAKFMRTN